MNEDDEEVVTSDGFAEELPFSDLAPAATTLPLADAKTKNSATATTLISELSTALGMIRRTLPEAVSHKPSELCDVSDEDWAVLTRLYYENGHDALFSMSFENGRAFAESEIALRHRQPGRIEWLGPRKLVGEHAIPADLRVDDVYLVSCKYNSKNFLNSGPAKLFDHRLKEAPRSKSWYEDVALDAYQDYYRAVRAHFDLIELPTDVVELTDSDRTVLAEWVPRRLPDELIGEQQAFCQAVSSATAERWAKSLGSVTQRNEFAMSMLRIPQAVYFLLGQSNKLPLRYKVLSRWDWAARFEINDFEITTSDALQPTVDWTLTTFDDRWGCERVACRDTVEIRWSHGRFDKSPEAKVYLDSPIGETPGYDLLDG